MSKKNSDKNKENLPIDDFSSDGEEIVSIGDEAVKTSADETTLTNSELEELQRFKSDYLYLKAEFDNFKRRTIKERSELIKYGSESFAREMLSVLDIFDMALATEPTAENLKSFLEGMQMTHTQFVQSLEKFNIVENTHIGDQFDPSLHEALSSEPTDSYKEGQITQVFKKGYKFHDKVLRPAQVVVAIPPAEKAEPVASDEEQN